MATPFKYGDRVRFVRTVCGKSTDVVYDATVKALLGGGIIEVTFDSVCGTPFTTSYPASCFDLIARPKSGFIIGTRKQRGGRLTLAASPVEHASRATAEGGHGRGQVALSSSRRNAARPAGPRTTSPATPTATPSASAAALREGRGRRRPSRHLKETSDNGTVPAGDA
jgi:hypothetical protein